MGRALIITAILPELQAVLRHFTVTGYDVDEQGTYYTLGEFTGNYETWDIGVIQVLQGNVRSAILTALGVTHFRPDVVLLVGVAGALKDLRLGDVVAAPVVRGYERGKDTEDGFLPRGEVFNSAHRLVQVAQHVVGQEHWQARILQGRGTPKALIDTIAAGEKLIATDRGPVRELLRKHVSDAVAVEMEGLGVLHAAHICEAKALVVRAASDNLADKDEADRADWQPIAASHAAAFAFELLHELQLPHAPDRGVDDGGRGGRGRPPGLPPFLQTTLDEVREIDAGIAAKLSDSLLFPPAAGAVVVSELVSAPPEWLATAPAAAWSLLGTLAELYEAPSASSMAFERAARLRPAFWWRWLARAVPGAVLAGDSDRAAALIGEAQHVAPDDVLVGTIAAIQREDYEGLTKLTSRKNVDNDEALLLDGFLAFALWQTGDQVQAGSLLDSLAQRYPDRAGPLIAQAHLLLARAVGDASQDRMRDLGRAVDLGIQARDRIHEWGGVATRAIEVAAEAALAADDSPTALRLALPSELGGEASDVEAEDPRVLGAAFKAAILGQRDDIASELAPRLRGTFSAALLEALQLKRRGSDSAVEQALDAALLLATEPAEVFAVLFHLADVGADLPEAKLKDMEAADPQLADIVIARLESAKGQFSAAQDRLRRWSGISAEANRALGHTYFQAGEFDKAIEVFRDGAKRFGTTTTLLDGVDMALASGKLDVAEAMAEDALLGLPGHHPGRAYALGRLIDIAMSRQEWRLMEERARLLRREADSEMARWALTVALYNQTRLEDAWTVVRQEPALVPTDPQRALLVISLLAEVASPERALREIVEIAERFPDSEEVVGTSLLQILTLRGADSAVNEFGERVNAIREGFVKRFPDSRIFRQVTIRAPEEILAKAQAELEPGSEELFRLEESVRNGEMPYGLLAIGANATYAEAIAIRGAGFLVAVAKTTEDAASDRDAARAALGQTVVVDTSAFSVLSQLTGAWQQLVSHFHKAYATDWAVRDALLARRKGRPSVVIVLDRSTKQATPVPIPPEQAKFEAEAIDRLAELMKSAEQLQSKSLAAFPHLEGADRHRPWLSPLQAARDGGFVLWSDDATQRQLAREIDVRAFSTSALVEVMAERGQVSPSQASEWTAEMIRSRVGDFPLDDDLLIEMAASSNWAPGPVSVALSRPSAWSDHMAAHALFHRIFTAVGQEAPDKSEFWLQVAILGSARHLPTAAHLLAGTLLAMSIAARRFEPAVTLRLVSAARAVCNEIGAPDPLPATVERMVQTATELLGPQHGAAMTVRAFSELPDVDRAKVRAIVFGVSQ